MTEESNNKKYELTFYLKDENAAAVKDALKKCGAEVLAERDLAKYRLSYPIKKEANAFMGSIIFSVDPASLANLNEILKLAPQVLRFVVTVAEERPLAASSAEAGSAARERGGFFRRLRSESKPPETVLTNEALEKKIEEISK